MIAALVLIGAFVLADLSLILTIPRRRWIPNDAHWREHAGEVAWGVCFLVVALIFAFAAGSLR